MTETPSTTLQELLTGWNERAGAHRDAVGQGWPIAEDFLRLHGDALIAFSKQVGSSPNEREQAALLVSTHGYNLYVGALASILRGQFDVAAYQLRPLLEAWVVFVAVARDEDFARRFLSHQLGTQDAWKRTRQELQKVEAELTQALDKTFREEWSVTNDLAHVSALHVDRLVERAGRSITPHAGGLLDREQAVALWQGATLQYARLLIYQRGTFSPVLSSEWQRQFEDAYTRYQVWMRALEQDNQQ